MTRIGVGLLACLVSSLASADEFTLFCIEKNTQVEGALRKYVEEGNLKLIEFHLEVNLDGGYVHVVNQNLIHRLNDPNNLLTVTPYQIELGAYEQDFWMQIDRKDGSYFVRYTKAGELYFGLCKMDEKLILNTLF